MLRLLLGVWMLLVVVLSHNADLETTVSPGNCECLIFKYNGRSQSTFYTPMFPHAYPANVHCLLYTFIGDVAHLVEITLLEFDLKLPVSSRCVDFLRLYLDLETTDLTKNPTWNYELCGDISTIPKQHYSASNVLILEFHSNHVQGNNTGFRGIYKFVEKAQFQLQGGSLRWGSKCTFHFHSNKINRAGRFFSPRYPQNYPPDTVCQYIFSAMRHERVAVVFKNIQLEIVNGSCTSSPDTIVVRDGPDNASPVIARYCNTLNSEAVLSSGENLFVELLSDGQNHRQGFAAVFDFIPEDQLVHNRAYSNIYSTRLTGHPPPPGIITHNPGDSPFIENQVASANGANSTTPKYKKPPVIPCDREFVSDQQKNGTFTSPFYPEPYAEGATCRYTFQGQGSERVQIIFRDFDLLFPHPCNPSQPIECEPMETVDFVRVMILVGESPSIIGLYCGCFPPPILMSSDDRLEVAFISRPRSTAAPSGTAPMAAAPSPHKPRGFKATYHFVQDFGIRDGERDSEMVCGFSFRSKVAPNGTFTSPNFPGLYPRNTECHYRFYGAENEVVYITFIYFDVEGIPPGCLEDTQSDYVEFSNFNIFLTDRKMTRFCGIRDPEMRRIVKSDGSFFRVTFKSNDIYDAMGFEAYYQFGKIEENFNQQRIRSGSSERNSPNVFLLFSALIFLTAFRTIVFSSSSVSLVTGTPPPSPTFSLSSELHTSFPGCSFLPFPPTSLHGSSSSSCSFFHSGPFSSSSILSFSTTQVFSSFFSNVFLRLVLSSSFSYLYRCLFFDSVLTASASLSS